MSSTWVVFFALALSAANGVIVAWPHRDDFKAAAAALDISLSDTMPGEDFLFEASVGKRAGTFLLEKAAEILAYIDAGLTEAEKLAASRLVRGYTTADYADRESDVEIGIRDGTTSSIGADAFWSLLCVPPAAAVTAMDVLGLHLVVITMILMKVQQADLVDTFGQFPVLQSAVRLMSPATRGQELEAAVQRATNTTRGGTFPSADIARSRTLDLSNRLHRSVLALGFDADVLQAAGISAVEL